MKIFIFLQRQYAIVGISPTNQFLQKYPFNKKIVLGFLIYGCVIVSQCVYICHVANGFMEYLECACAISTTVIMFVCFVATVFRKITLFKTIDNIEKLIDTSEYHLEIVIHDIIDKKFHNF